MDSCTVDGCNGTIKAKDYCTKHYRRWLKHGTIEPIPKPERVCSVDGCVRKHLAKGYCNKHYRRIKKSGSLKARPRGNRLKPTVAETNKIIISDDRRAVVMAKRARTKFNKQVAEQFKLLNKLYERARAKEIQQLTTEFKLNLKQLREG